VGLKTELTAADVLARRNVAGLKTELTAADVLA